MRLASTCRASSKTYLASAVPAASTAPGVTRASRSIVRRESGTSMWRAVRECLGRECLGRECLGREWLGVGRALSPRQGCLCLRGEDTRRAAVQVPRACSVAGGTRDAGCRHAAVAATSVGCTSSDELVAANGATTLEAALQGSQDDGSGSIHRAGPLAGSRAGRCMCPYGAGRLVMAEHLLPRWGRGQRSPAASCDQLLMSTAHDKA